MALSRAKYKSVPDLYVRGTEVILKDGTVCWVQTLNPFEQDEANSAAQVARSRMILALKEHGSDDWAKVVATFFQHGREMAIDTIVESQFTDIMVKVGTEIQNDPDWKERLDIAARQDDILAKPLEDPERKLLAQINEDYVAETTKRINEETEYERGRLEKATDDELIDEYRKLYLERQGNAVAMAEHNLIEMWKGVRVCDGVFVEDNDKWDHSNCESHYLQVYETKAEVRALPEDLQNLYLETLRDLNMTVREAKNSDRQGSSSDSSPLPSEAAESTPSTPIETPTTPPGT